MMLINIFYLVLAILGLGFLIFIHELGHYLVARKIGIKVEVFSIGFGPAIRQWTVNGVKWQLCILPFGGYVRMAGMEKKQESSPAKFPMVFMGKLLSSGFWSPLLDLLSILSLPLSLSHSSGWPADKTSLSTN